MQPNQPVKIELEIAPDQLRVLQTVLMTQRPSEIETAAAMGVVAVFANAMQAAMQPKEGE